MAKQTKLEMPAGPPEAEQQESERSGILAKIKGAIEDKIDDRRQRQIHDLPDGRYVTHATWELLEQGHEYLGREGFILVRESPRRGLENWRRYNPKEDDLPSLMAAGDARPVLREFTKKPGGGPGGRDEIYMVVGREVTCIGHTPSASLLARIAAFEGRGIEQVEKGERATPGVVS